MATMNNHAANQSNPGNTVTASPIRQLEIFKPGTFNAKKLELRQNGNTVLWTNKSSSPFSQPQIDIQLSDKTIVASVKLQSFSRDLLLHLGNPDCSDKAQWANLVCENFGRSKYKFVHNGKTCSWTRTHNKEIGARRIGGRDFKLVDEATGQVLVVYRFNYGLFKGGVNGNIDFYVQLDSQLELLSLAAILGIEEGIARRQRSSAGAAGGGGGGGG